MPYMTSLNTEPEARLCPACNGDNRCAVAQGRNADDCWCQSASFQPQQVAAYRGLQRCLCENCGTVLPDTGAVEFNPASNKDSHGQ